MSHFKYYWEDKFQQIQEKEMINLETVETVLSLSLSNFFPWYAAIFMSSLYDTCILSCFEILFSMKIKSLAWVVNHWKIAVQNLDKRLNTAGQWELNLSPKSRQFVKKLSGNLSLFK